MLYVINAETNNGIEVLAVADNENVADKLADEFIKNYKRVCVEQYSNCHILFDHDDKLVVINGNEK